MEEPNQPHNRSYETPALEMVVKAVCGHCNSGWMSQLEDACREMLTALVRGQARPLPLELQVLLSRWFAKTAALLGTFHQGSIVLGDNDLQQIAYEDSAPAGWLIRLAFLDGIGNTPSHIYGTTGHVIPIEHADTQPRHGDE